LAIVKRWSEKPEREGRQKKPKKSSKGQSFRRKTKRPQDCRKVRREKGNQTKIEEGPLVQKKSVKFEKESKGK